MDVIAAAYARLESKADALVVEGAGGALVPLGPATDMLDIAARLELPGAARRRCPTRFASITRFCPRFAIRARGLTLAGWIANRIDREMREGDANVSVLTHRLGLPPCADFGWRDDAATALQFGRCRARLGLGPLR
jgi:dethiobiotin synthetase